MWILHRLIVQSLVFHPSGIEPTTLPKMEPFIHSCLRRYWSVLCVCVCMCACVCVKIFGWYLLVYLLVNFNSVSLGNHVMQLAHIRIAFFIVVLYPGGWAY